MILKKIQKQVDGGLETQWMLTEAQAQFLINYAVTSLLEKGLIEVLSESENQTEEEIQLDLLDSLDKDKLFKA